MTALRPGITVAIPSIPPRAQLLERALASVHAQTLPPTGGVSVALDSDHEGAPATRQRALEAVDTEWVAFLDDDDEFLPEHLARLHACAQETGADYVYPWFTTVPDSCDPFPHHFGQPFDPQHPVETTITILVRTELARSVGFARIPQRRHNTGEDWRFTLGCISAGARIVHLPERTWLWHHDSGNTSGMPDRWH